MNTNNVQIFRDILIFLLCFNLIIVKSVNLKYRNKRSLLLIYPGTNWCGPGNRAKNYDDLGTEVETDLCCRAHDDCKDYISAKQQKHGLRNPRSYTSLNCDCDTTFYECLTKSELDSSKEVARIYFNYVGNPCFKYDYPIINCSKYYEDSEDRCKEYNLNTNDKKTWGWYDIPIF